MIAGFKEKLGFWPKSLLDEWELKQNWIWFHAVSVGEINAIKPLILKIKEEKKENPIMLSTTTRAGYELAKDFGSKNNITIFFFPFDIPLTINRLFNLVKIKALIITETEIWPNLLRACKSNNVPVFLVNARLSDNSFKNYHLLKFYFKDIVNLFTEVLSQSESDTKKFKELGLNEKKIKTLGNLKFVTNYIASQPKENSPILKIIFASTHKGEDEIAIEAYKKLNLKFENIRLVIAPRHIDRAEEIKKIVRSGGFNPILKTENKSQDSTKDVLILNTIGELQKFYEECKITVLCGTFVKVGGHNILESIRSNSYTIIGPYDYKIKSLSSYFLKNEAIIQVKNKDDLLQSLSEAISNKELRMKKIENGIRLIKENQNVLNDTKDRLLLYI